MRLVVVESPYAGDVEANLRYLRAAMADCLRRDEAPYASHALYTQPGVLRDEVPEERNRGIWAGFRWADKADAVVFYCDRGWSRGMLAAVGRHYAAGLRLERRFLGVPWSDGSGEREIWPPRAAWELLYGPDFAGPAPGTFDGHIVRPTPPKRGTV